MVREIKQPIARQNTIGILRECVQQIEFLACECNHFAIGLQQLVPIHVQHDRSKLYKLSCVFLWRK